MCGMVMSPGVLIRHVRVCLFAVECRGVCYWWIHKCMFPPVVAVGEVPTGRIVIIVVKGKGTVAAH